MGVDRVADVEREPLVVPWPVGVLAGPQPHPDSVVVDEVQAAEDVQRLIERRAKRQRIHEAVVRGVASAPASESDVERLIRRRQQVAGS